MKVNLSCRDFVQAIICGKVKEAPVQKILRNGRTVTIFSVGTGGMYDQRIVGNKDLPKPAQWHRIAVHNDTFGAYAVQQLAKKYAFMLYENKILLIEDKKRTKLSVYCFGLTNGALTQLCSLC